MAILSKRAQLPEDGMEQHKVLFKLSLGSNPPVRDFGTLING